MDPPGVGAVLVEELRSTLDRATELVRALEGRLGEASQRFAADQEAAALQARLQAAEADMRELAGRLVKSEHQAERLMNLYVATYQLHATLDPEAVRSTIAEIAINLLGAEKFVLLLQREDGQGYEVALAHGLDPDYDRFWIGPVYRGGDAMVDETLRGGNLLLGPIEGSAALAAVPLRIQEHLVGAVVLLKLLDHKPKLRTEDRDLLDLLSAHAASALFGAHLFASKERKLKTLESLVQLVRGE
jgi:hypothetical protein